MTLLPPCHNMVDGKKVSDDDADADSIVRRRLPREFLSPVNSPFRIHGERASASSSPSVRSCACLSVCLSARLSSVSVCLSASAAARHRKKKKK